MSKVPTVMSAGLALLKAAVGAQIVFDGPEPTGEAPPVAVTWGYDGNPTGPRIAVQNWRQTFVGIGVGAQRKDESFEVVGAVVAETGDEVVGDRRADAFGVFAAVETECRTAELSTWGLTAPALVEFVSGTLYQEQGRSGLRCRIPFIVAVSRVRI